MNADDRAPGRVPARSQAATTLLPRFLEHRRRDVGTVRAALERGDFATIARIGHNLSGNGLSYGFPEMSAIGERLEAAANAGNANAVDAQLASLQASLARIDAEGTRETAARTESSTRVRAMTDDPKSARKTGQR